MRSLACDCGCDLRKRIKSDRCGAPARRVLQLDPVGKRGAQQTPNTGADNPSNRNAFLLQDFNDSQMRKSPGEAATQGLPRWP